MVPLILLLALSEPNSVGARAARESRLDATRREPPAEPAPRPPEAGTEAARVLARLSAGEPSIEDVQAAAARRAGFDLDRAESWRARSRSSAWLPKLTAEFKRDEQSYHVTGLTGSGEVDYLRSAPGEVFMLRATWDLDALIFNSAEVQAAAAAATLLRRRDELVEHATRLFFKRQRLRWSLLAAAAASPPDRVEVELELAEVTSELNALTGGRFSGRAP